MKYNFCVFLEENKRVDMYLSALFVDYSRSYIQKMIDKGQVTINGVIVNKNLKIKNKDEIIIEIQVEKLDIEAQNIKLDIVYEDSEFIVINKDAGLNVHPVPGIGGKENTLVNALLFHCKNLASIGGVERPGIVHRLDKDTSGIIMVAKTDKMMNYLANIIKNRQIGKYYLAIVSGILTNHKFKIESYIGRDPNDRLKMTTKNPINPKIAITNGEVLKYIDNKYSLIKLKIETGRTHQIRVHLASIGYPIIGDKVYGNPKVNREAATIYQLQRQALHAYELEFDLYGKQVQFIGDLKEDMERIINI